MTLIAPNKQINFFQSFNFDWKNLLTRNAKSLSEIAVKNLIEQLKNLSNVEQVRAVTYDIAQPNRITFEILTFSSSWEEEKVIMDKAMDLVVSAEWELCDNSKSEDWHFDTQILGEFENINKKQIVDFSYAKSRYVQTAS